jgi:hypothetical protein
MTGFTTIRHGGSASQAKLSWCRTGRIAAAWCAALALAAAASATAADWSQPWPRHAIDASSRGADGVRLADVNGDSLLDVVTGWEEGGRIGVCLHPGRGGAAAAGQADSPVRSLWPSVTVGTVRAPEDAVFVDLDGDGAVDVVSCCEGSERTVYIHWAPKDRRQYLDPKAWTTQPLPASRAVAQWMFCLPMDTDAAHGIDLVAGAKNQGAAIGCFRAPPQPRDLASWTWHAWRPCGWLMSLVAEDMDGDGDLDVLFSDRKGPRRGVYWLENPGPDSPHNSWMEHVVGGRDAEVMFLDVTDLDGDGLRDVVAATSGEGILYLRRTAPHGDAWQRHVIPVPQGIGSGKAVCAGDVDGDGRMDLVLTCENATAPQQGCVWLRCRGTPGRDTWEAYPISGPEGTKFDRVELVDVDGDGDLDAITCEERDNLGVFWYENPLRP